MPGNRNPRNLENYIGEHTTAELAALPIEVVRQGNWCWNISNTRPEIYDGAAWVPFGGGAAGVNVEDDNVAVLTPALTINFGPGLDAVDAGGAQADVTPEWGAGIPGNVAPAGANGVATTVARFDHLHQGVHSISEVGQPQLYGDVLVAEGANITLAQVGQTITISASGSLAAAPTERPDKFHFFKTGGQSPDGTSPTLGAPSQRCMARSSTYNNTYYLFRDDALAEPNQIMLRIEHLSTVPGVNTALDRCVWDVEITIPEAENPGASPGTYTIDSLSDDDFCLVIDDNDLLHIVIIGTEIATARQMVIDAVLDITTNAVLQVPTYATAAAPPQPMALLVIAETVTNVVTAGTLCREVSAAFTANSVASPVGSTVFVVWVQSTAPVAVIEVYSNTYDPAAPVGGKYPGVRSQVSPVGPDQSRWPTVEVGDNNVYVMYIEDSKPVFALSAFDYTTWSTMAVGVGVSDVVANCPTTDNPMSMAVATFDGTVDVIYFVIEDTVGQGEKFLVALLEDFLTTGTGASYNISVYDTFNPIEPEKYFQIGLNKIAWTSEDCAPTVFMLHGKFGLINQGNDGPIEIHLTIISPDLTDGFIASDLPVAPSGPTRLTGGNIQDTLTKPKIHYAYEEYNRVWDGDAGVDYTYYPIMVYGTLTIYSWDIDNSQFTNTVSLWIKDIPEYPYVCVEKAY